MWKNLSLVRFVLFDTPLLFPANPSHPLLPLEYRKASREIIKDGSSQRPIKGWVSHASSLSAASITFIPPSTLPSTPEISPFPSAPVSPRIDPSNDGVEGEWSDHAASRISLLPSPTSSFPRIKEEEEEEEEKAKVEAEFSHPMYQVKARMSGCSVARKGPTGQLFPDPSGPVWVLEIRLIRQEHGFQDEPGKELPWLPTLALLRDTPSSSSSPSFPSQSSTPMELIHAWIRPGWQMLREDIRTMDILSGEAQIGDWRVELMGEEEADQLQRQASIVRRALVTSDGLVIESPSSPPPSLKELILLEGKEFGVSNPSPFMMTQEHRAEPFSTADKYEGHTTSSVTTEGSITPEGILFQEQGKIFQLVQSKWIPHGTVSMVIGERLGKDAEEELWIEGTNSSTGDLIVWGKVKDCGPIQKVGKTRIVLALWHRAPAQSGSPAKAEIATWSVHVREEASVELLVSLLSLK